MDIFGESDVLVQEANPHLTTAEQEQNICDGGILKEAHPIQPVNAGNDKSQIKLWCNDHGNKLYDLFAITISLIDFVTDVLILIEFYETKKNNFFIASVIILIIAQISYTCAFLSRYRVEFGKGCHNLSFNAMPVCLSILYFCITTLLILCIAPILSIIICHVESKNRTEHRVCIFFCVYVVTEETYDPQNFINVNKSRLRKWMDKKLRSHLGFILESLLEAFPQSILQMIAIVYFKDYNNYMAIASILISMCSVCSKSLVFAAGTALDKSTLFFNWLCVVTDFFGLFFMISWIFYDEAIFTIFTFQILVTVVPLSLWIMVWFYAYALHSGFDTLQDVWDDHYREGCRAHMAHLCLLIVAVIVFAGITAFMCVCFAVSIMLFSIFHFTLIALLFWNFGTKRYHFENETNANSYNTMIDWINHSQKWDTSLFQNLLSLNSDSKGVANINYKISKEHDRIIRVCCTNWYMLHEWNLGIALPKLYEYLQSQYPSTFIAVKYADLRNNTDMTRKSQFLKTLFFSYFGMFFDRFESYKEEKAKRNGSRNEDTVKQYLFSSIFWAGVVFCVGILYLISRIIGVFYPIIIYMHLYVFGNNESTIVMEFNFQFVMMSIYVFLETIICFIFVVWIYKLQFVMWHILPGRGSVVLLSNDVLKAQERIDGIKNCYAKIVEKPIIYELLIVKFGKDVADIIMHYSWQNDQEFKT